MWESLCRLWGAAIIPVVFFGGLGYIIWGVTAYPNGPESCPPGSENYCHVVVHLVRPPCSGIFEKCDGK